MEQEEWPGMSLNKIVAPSSCRQLYNFPIFDSLPSLSSRRPTPARSPSIICSIPVAKALLRVLGAVLWAPDAEGRPLKILVNLL